MGKDVLVCNGEAVGFWETVGVEIEYGIWLVVGLELEDGTRVGDGEGGGT